MTSQAIIKYSRIVAGVVYLLIGVFMIVGSINVSLTDDRTKVVMASAFLALAGVAVVWLGVKRLRDAKRTA
jgi:predicted MFS family arabinose efflux permease